MAAARRRDAFFGASLLAVLLLASAACGCTEDGPVRAHRVSPPARPGERGRKVLWVVPRASSLAGGVDPEALQAIGRIASLQTDTREGLETLGFYVDDQRLAVRQSAIRAALGSKHAEAPLTVLAFVRDRHPAIAAEAMAAIRTWDLEDRVTIFERAVRSPVHATCRGAAVAWSPLLAGVAAPRRAAIVGAAFDEVEDVPARMLLLDQHCADTEVAPLLVRAAQNVEPGIRAMVTLCRLAAARDPELPVADLAQALQGVLDDVRALVAHRLIAVAAHLDPRQRTLLTPALAAAADLDGPRAGASVAAAQAALGIGPGLETLATLVDAGTADARLEALEALRGLIDVGIRVRHPRLGNGLADATTDPDSLTRRLATEVAGLCGDGSVVPALVARLSDPDTTIRAAAAYSLGQLKADQAAAALIEKGLATPDPKTRDVVFAVLHHLVHGMALPPAALAGEWIDDPGKLRDDPRFWGRNEARWRRWMQSGK